LAVFRKALSKEIAWNTFPTFILVGFFFSKSFETAKSRSAVRGAMRESIVQRRVKAYEAKLREERTGLREPNTPVNNPSGVDEMSTMTGSTSASTLTITSNTKINNPKADANFEVCIQGRREKINTARESGKTKSEMIKEHAAIRTKLDDGGGAKAAEELLGTHVSFTEGADDGSTSSSHQNGSNASLAPEDQDGTDGETDELSGEAKLMAAIAQATGKQGKAVKSSKDKGFFATAMNAVAGKLASQFDTSATNNQKDYDERKEESKGEMFDRIDKQIVYSESTLLEDPNRDSQAMDDIDWACTPQFREMERLLLFTDVIDRNPPPGSRSAVSSPQPQDLFWMLPEVHLQELCNTINKTVSKAYTEAEKQRKEVERTLFFTDVPDAETGKDKFAPTYTHSTSNGIASYESSDQYQLSVSKTASNGDSALSSSMLQKQISREEAPLSIRTLSSSQPSREESVRSNCLRSSSVAPQRELDRLFKELEKQFLFTDLPEPKGRMSSSPLTAPMANGTKAGETRGAPTCAPQVDCSGLSYLELQRRLCFTDLDRYREISQKESQDAGSRLMSQILAEDNGPLRRPNELAEKLQSRMEEVRKFQQHHSVVEKDDKYESERVAEALPTECDDGGGVEDDAVSISQSSSTSYENAHEESPQANGRPKGSSELASVADTAVDTLAYSAVTGSEVAQETQTQQTDCFSLCTEIPEEDATAAETTGSDKSCGRLSGPKEIESSSEVKLSDVSEPAEEREATQEPRPYDYFSDCTEAPEEVVSTAKPEDNEEAKANSWTSQDDQNLDNLMLSESNGDCKSVPETTSEVSSDLAKCMETNLVESSSSGLVQKMDAAVAAGAASVGEKMDAAVAAGAASVGDVKSVTSDHQSHEKFDALLAEMKQLETTIDSDLERAHTILSKP